MKKTILYLLALLIIPIAASGGGTTVVVGQAVASGACTISEQQTTNTDFWPPSGTDYIAQGILDKGSKTLCKVYVTLDVTSGEYLHGELWTTADRTGSQIGGDSNNFLTVTDAADEEYEVEWTSYPSVTAAYFLHIVANDESANFSWCANTDDTTYGTGATADNMSRSGGTDLNCDGVFKIYYE